MPASSRPDSITSRVAGGVAALAAGCVLVALGFVLVWAVADVRARPPRGGEGEALFEAARMRAHLPLYTDPIAGAWEQGAPPARYYVLYPPLWSWALSLLPAPAPSLGFGAALEVARLAALVSWLGALAFLVVRADADARRHALAFAAFFASIFNLALFAVAARPDALAALCAAVALGLATRHGGAGAVAGALFAVAAWTKPTVIGLGAGAIGATMLVAPRLALRAAASVAAVSLAIASLLDHVSGGAWLRHLVAATLQPFDFGHWLASVTHEAFFFFAPVAYALARAWKGRADPRLVVGFGALAGAFGCAVVLVGKSGSATNYWIESALGVVAITARTRPPSLTARPALAGAALAQALWSGVASVRSVPESLAADARIDALLAGARRTCGARDGDFVLADEVGVELLQNGRSAANTYQLSFLVRAGRFPVAPWIADVTRSDVTCFVEHFGAMRRVPELSRALDARFEAAAGTDGWAIRRLRIRPL